MDNPFNIMVLGKCVTVNDDGIYLSTDVCNKSEYQNFYYDKDDSSIKFQNRCLNVSNIDDGAIVTIQNCDHSKNQSWKFDINSIKLNLGENKCMDLDNGDIKIWNCWNGKNQRFIKVPYKFEIQSNMPKIIRNNMIIPNGALPVPHLSILPNHSLLLINSEQKSILIHGNNIINKNSKEINCLGIIVKFVIAPFTRVIITYQASQSAIKDITFINDTAEHDLIYDYETSFDYKLKDILYQINSYNVSHSSLGSIKSISNINYNIKSGIFMISKTEINENFDNFSIPSPATMIDARSALDYLLGPYTIVQIGNSFLYNSGSKPLYYKSLMGPAGTNFKSYIASPLDSGYTKLTSKCGNIGYYDRILLGEYSVENRKISGIVIGPYTRVIFINHNNTPISAYENNNPTEKKYDLCQKTIDLNISSIIVEFSNKYIGFGLITSHQIYVPMSFDETCPILMPTSHPLLFNSLKNPIYEKKSTHPFNMDCESNPIVSFNLKNENGTYYRYYNCNDHYSYHTTNIPTQIVANTSLNHFLNLRIDCGAKAITGVKAIINGNFISYEYKCGDINLGNMKNNQTIYQSGYPTELKQLLNQKVDCGPTGQLTAYVLKGSYDGDNEQGVKYNYLYEYRCGTPIEEFRTIQNEEKFRTIQNEEKFRTIRSERNENNVVFLIFIILFFYLLIKN
uniref:Ricin B lectin domain-containing protein n=1 Tax=viral metagenome TaxID=1070528 RepID=A0A6C0LS94_9ZZZZ